jgi:hypothetical protein
MGGTAEGAYAWIWLSACWNTNKLTNGEGHVIVAVRRQILTAEARIRYK